MATVPTVPTFTDGTAPSAANMEALAQAVNFLVDCDQRPIWHFLAVAGQAIPSNAFTTVKYTNVAVDSDAVFTSASGTATIVTQGYYDMEYCLGIQSAASGASFSTRFIVTAGTHNPNHTSGTQIFNICQSSLCAATAATDTVAASAWQCPWVLYPGDNVAVQIDTTVALNTTFNFNTSFIDGRFVANFTGYYSRYGVFESTDT
jgi:hypothetical protein